jgi:hypothetical protein
VHAGHAPCSTANPYLFIFIIYNCWGVAKW